VSTDKAVYALLRKLKRNYGTPEYAKRSPMEEFIVSFLTWEGPVQRADPALKRLIDGSIDLNELRVTRPEDLVSIIGKTYPNAEERAERLHLALNDLYVREHAVTLDRVIAMSKRDGRKYVEELEGMLPYISARIALVALDTHAIPIDDRTLDLLIAEGVVEEGSTIEKAVGKLERHIKSTDAMEAHLLFQQWAETEAGATPSRQKKGASRSAGGRTPKKSTSRRKTATK
jgi:hypothetical protein